MLLFLQLIVCKFDYFSIYFLIENCIAIQLSTNSTNNIITFKIVFIKLKNKNIAKSYSSFSFWIMFAAYQKLEANLTIFYFHL